MEKTFLILLVAGAFIFTSCNSSDTKKDSPGAEMKNMNKDSSQNAISPDDKNVKSVAVTFTDVDVKVAASIKEIIGHYLHLKNALVDDNASEAASAAKEMTGVLEKVDKSFFTAEQKRVYDDIDDDLKEHAEHIGKNANDIEHQREHFSMMSGDVYDLAKAFGGGQTLYHDHCPMYNEGTGGAMWLSETMGIRNPYLGTKMPTCGKVEEKIK